jgi:type I restriction enzyme R subunit
MVMLVRNLALDPEIQNPRIVLVTDRDDLDKQLGNTFAACGLEANRATSGRNLLELVAEKKAGIITTLIHKFDKAYAVKKYQDESPDIFMLVDESHRTQFGSFCRPDEADVSPRLLFGIYRHATAKEGKEQLYQIR